MTILNSADLRNNLASVLEQVVLKKKPVMIGRFGQPKAVLVDVFTYNWQKQVMDLIQKIDKLTVLEIETLNILVDPQARQSILLGLQQIQSGEVISLDDFLKE